jgi:FdhD protein
LAVVDPVRKVAPVLWRAGAVSERDRQIPEETAIALTYGGSTQAVMMATPHDLRDFALGFSFTEGLIRDVADVESLDVVKEEDGIELRMWLVPERAETYSRRRRMLAGPTGCGLCGVESLEEAVKPASRVRPGLVVDAAMIAEAMDALPGMQAMNRTVKAMHAAAFYLPGQGITAVREDVGRHNALDKLVGHLFASGTDAAGGIVLMTSRVSVEIVQKAAAIGASILVAVSAPTALAVRMAEASGMTLIAVARDDQFEVFTHPERIAGITVPA